MKIQPKLTVTPKLKTLDQGIEFVNNELLRIQDQIDAIESILDLLNEAYANSENQRYLRADDYRNSNPTILKPISDFMDTAVNLGVSYSKMWKEMIITFDGLLEVTKVAYQATLEMSAFIKRINAKGNYDE
ncbi:MAG: hypothetical protein OXI43_08760 [Candidatus Poribacteria bacterium]|nr:hypothetical protein [Candidatus Poribacteria bacterium]